MARGSGNRPPPAAGGSHLRWVMLDRVVHCTKDEPVRDGTLSETSATCTGQTLAVSLRAAPPPAVSRLHLHWPEGLRPEMAEVDPPQVIAAHGHSILFQAYVPHIDQSRPPYYPLDYFLYTASGGRHSPSLRRLPPCFDGGQVDQQTDQLFQPYRLQQQRLMPSENIGLLCHGDEEFTVAELSCNGELCLLHHAPGMGEPMRWVVQKLQMPNCNDAPDLFSDSWQTDVVVPYGGSSLCWVDCYLGLFFVTVRGDLTRKPHYVPMPAALDPRRLYIDPGCPDPARRVCVTDGGTIKLICISDLAGRSVHGRHHHIFKITTWELTDKEWELDATVEASELWAALSSDKRLPLIRPEFPTVSLVDHDVVCFVLNDGDVVSWLIEVDLKKKVLGAVTLYIDEEEEEKQAAEGEQTKFHGFAGISFIPSQFTMYLDKHVIKSKKLEQAKLKRGMEEAWIKDPKQVLV